MSGDIGLNGKVAVVVGASRGWGRACALGLADQGVQIVVSGTNAGDVTATAKEIEERGGRAVAVVESAATMKGAQRIIAEAVKAYGKVDILVYSAGINRPGTILTTTEEDWDTVIAVELKGVFACTKFAAQQMVKQGEGGRIIIMGGGSGMRGVYGRGGKSAAKGGVLGIMQSWALELEEYGITVNCVRGGVRTPGNAPQRERAKERLRAQGKPVPTDGELGYYEPEESAPLIVWLASEDAKDVTGQNIGIDGPKVTLWGYSQPVRVAYMVPLWSVDTMVKHLKPAIQGGFQQGRGRSVKQTH